MGKKYAHHGIDHVVTEGGSPRRKRKFNANKARIILVELQIMVTDFAGELISEGILKRLKETLQVQSELSQNDLSIQLSSMEASTSTLSEVKSILDNFDKKTMRNVADQLANTDVHFLFQRYLIKCYYFVKPDGSAASLPEEGNLDEPRPSGVLIFCPLYANLMDLITSLLVSPMLASNIASTKLIQLVLWDLDMLVQPGAKPDQYKMPLGNILFLWELSKQPGTLAAFRSFSDTILILINVYTSYQGPFEQLTTLVKSLALFIAGGVADEETSIYLLAEETCLDFLVELLTKSMCNMDKYLNYHGVYAVDIAKCIENLGQFVQLRETLLEKGVVQLLVSMIQIGDHCDDSAAASALNQLMATDDIVDEPVLFQGLVSSACPDPGISRETLGVNAKVKLLVTEIELGQYKSEKEKSQQNNEIQEVEDEKKTVTSKKSMEHENVEIKGKTGPETKNETALGATTQTITEETKLSKNVTSTADELKISSPEGRNEFATGCQKGKDEVTGKDDDEQIVGTIAQSRNCNDIKCTESEPSQEKGILINSTKEKMKTEKPLTTMDTEVSNHQDVTVCIQKQLENLGEGEIKFIQIPSTDLSDVSDPVLVHKEPHLTRSFQHQDGSDHMSGQELQKIHTSLIELGVHNMYDEKLVSLLNEILDEKKLREDGVFDLLKCLPDIYSYKMLRTGSMERQLRVVPASNDPDLKAPFTHVQPEIDYHLVLKKFIFKFVPDKGAKLSFPGFTLIGPWCERIPRELEEWSFCFVPQASDLGMTLFYFSAEKLKSNFFFPILLTFAGMNVRYSSLVEMGESLERENLKKHGITVRKIEENGPAVTVYYLEKNLTVDYVLSLRHICWPSCASSWQYRLRHWPDNQTVKDVVNYGCHLVPKQPPTLSKDDPLYGMFFQYSFARAENVLLNKLNEDNKVLTDCLRMLKFLCGLLFDRPQLLKSYHMQTIVLHAAERAPPSHWKATNFVKHLLDLLDDLLHHLVTQNLPNYFVPQQNLFEQFSPDFIWDVAARVSKVRRDPIKYLTPSHDPAKFGIYLI